MKYTLKISAGILLALMALSCRHKPFLPDEPQVSFKDNILPLIGGNCNESGCHDGNGDHEAFPMLKYEDFLHGTRIVRGDAHSSTIYQSIVSQQAGTVMPRPPRAPLSDTQIKLIYLWIMQGAKNN